MGLLYHYLCHNNELVGFSGTSVNLHCFIYLPHSVLGTHEKEGKELLNRLLLSLIVLAVVYRQMQCLFLSILAKRKVFCLQQPRVKPQLLTSSSLFYFQKYETKFVYR